VGRPYHHDWNDDPNYQAHVKRKEPVGFQHQMSFKFNAQIKNLSVLELQLLTYKFTGKGVTNSATFVFLLRAVYTSKNKHLFKL
jgi:hypothetical protein